MTKLLNLKSFRQTSGLCGPASLKIVLEYFGKDVSEAEIAKLAGATKENGASKEGLVRAVKKLGFHAFYKENSSLKEIKKFYKKKIPIIVDWFSGNEGHYSAVAGIDKKNIFLMDPESAKIKKMKLGDFSRVWFDFPGDFIKKPRDLILRMAIAVLPKK